MAGKPVSAKRKSTLQQRAQRSANGWLSPAMRTRALIGSMSALLLAFCVYRILTFVPQPLDSPGTLRPVLYALFTRFVKRYPNPEQAQQAWASFCLLALTVAPMLALLNYFARHSGTQWPAWVHKVARSRQLFFGSVAGCLAVCRFPGLFVGQINPDEQLFLAAAHKLFRDPIFFRAVDCGTSGPFNIFPLMFPALFGISPDYASARLIALLIIFVSICLIYCTFALLADEAVARIAILPAAGAFAVIKQRDFQLYISEYVPLILLAVALYVCAKILHSPHWHAWRVAGLGSLTAAAFLTKMQAVPMVGCVSLVAVACIYGSGHARRWWRPLFFFAAGLAPLLALNAIICTAAGVWHDFWLEYIVANYNYAQSHVTVAGEISRFADFVLSVEDMRLLIVTLFAILAAYVYQTIRSEGPSDLTMFVQMGAVSGFAAVAGAGFLRAGGSGIAASAGVFALALLPGSFILLCRNGDRRPAPVRWFGFLTAAVLASALVAVYAPHRPFRPFEHYLILLVFPLTMAMAWPVIACFAGPTASGSSNGGPSPGRRSGSPLPFVLLFVTLTLLRQLSLAGPAEFVNFGTMPSTVRPPGSELIDSFTQPTDGITVWGWDSPAYLGAGRFAATKDIVTPNLFRSDDEVRVYYRDAYLRALRRHPPKLFVDAVASSWGAAILGKSQGFEVIPEISAAIQAGYVHVLDAYGQRFYIRRDLARSVAGIGNPRRCDPQAIRCFEASAKSWIPADLPPIQLPEHALLEVTFTPETKQDRYATVFSNAADATANRGFQFQQVEGDHYQLAIGCGAEMVFSKELSLPGRQPAALAIEFDGAAVTIVCNGTKCAEMRLPSHIVDSPGPITVGSWIGQQRPFLGNIQLFQIRSLGRRR
jgi:hypothetical protein